MLRNKNKVVAGVDFLSLTYSRLGILSTAGRGSALVFPEALRLGFPLVVFVASGTAFTSAPRVAGAPPACSPGAARVPITPELPCFTG